MVDLKLNQKEAPYNYIENQKLGYGYIKNFFGFKLNPKKLLLPFDSFKTNAKIKEREALDFEVESKRNQAKIYAGITPLR